MTLIAKVNADGEAPVRLRTAPVANAGKPHRLYMLDGWRGISILCVLAGHLLPLGPARYHMNECFAALGMTLFFTLSGFLITTTLIEHPSARDFLIRRLCRILPLAWLFTLIALTVVRAPLPVYVAQLLFYANLPPFWLLPITGHLWSLCVEMQFYMVTALLFGLFGRRGLYLLPLFGVGITMIRLFTGTEISIVTYKRADEILAGASLALIFHHFHQRRWPRRFGFATIVLLILAAIASHPSAGGIAYLRPYFGAALIGSTMFCAESAFAIALTARWLAYVAEISYSLYVIHPIMNFGWFSPASKIAKYARRPIGLALTFLLAHCSTRYYEARWIAFGKRLTRRRQPELVRQPVTS